MAEISSAWFRPHIQWARRISAESNFNRCQRDIADLIQWLRSHGVVSRTPLHTLRKEYGSEINALFGRPRERSCVTPTLR
jgi:hypothetical protein